MGSLGGDRLTQAGVKESPDDKPFLKNLAGIGEPIYSVVAYWFSFVLVGDEYRLAKFIIFGGYFSVSLTRVFLFTVIASTIATIVHVTEPQFRKYLIELIWVMKILIEFFDHFLKILLFLWFTFCHIY